MGRNNRTRRGRLPRVAVEFRSSELTLCAGLAPLISYCFDKLGLVVGSMGKRTFWVHLVLLAFLFSQLAGFHRLRHIAALSGDAVLCKWLRLPRWPSRKVFSMALAGISKAALMRLEGLLTKTALLSLPKKDKLPVLIVDIDNVNLTCYGQQEGAIFSPRATRLGEAAPQNAM